MNSGGRVLIVEVVLPDGDIPRLGKLTDMVVLVFPGGQEHTRAEYNTLLNKAGFRMRGLYPTASPISIVEIMQN